MEEIQDVEQAIYWLQAMIYQGDRLLKSYKAKGHITHTSSRMEEQFFINVAYKARRWVSKLKKLNVAVTDMDIFLGLVDAQFLRNKREHDDNYLGLNSKKEPLVDATGTTGPNIRVAQSVTVFRNGQILLGGTLDVHRTINAAGQALIPLIEMQHGYWKKRRAPHFQAPRTLIDK
jgi:hypothetical protein